MTPSLDPSYYRPAAGIALLNKNGKVFVGQRAHSYGEFRWQMPQGGIDEGETPLDGAVRELEEETGVHLRNIEFVAEIEDWLYYDFPPEITRDKWLKKWRGQRQKWFAFMFNGTDEDICLTAHHQIEFENWRWEPLQNTPSLIVPFKRPVYERVATEFERYTLPIK